MKNIIEIIPSLNSASGGAEILFANLCKTISKQNDIKLTIVLLYDGINERFNSLINEKIDIVTLHKKKGIDFKCANRLKKTLLDINPDIVHCHLNVVLTYYLAFRFKKMKWKTFCTIHSLPQKDETLLGNLIRKKYARYKIMNFIGISKSITQEGQKYYKTNMFTTIENGFEQTSLMHNANPIKKYDLICVAVFKPAKNHRLLFDAIKDVNRVSKQRLTLACAGEGPLFNSMKEYSVNLGLDNIVFLGQVNDVYPILNQSKVFVLSSSYEGNPISVLEAMACGLPIIAPNVGGIPDIVQNNVSGILFEPNNKEQLVSSILKISSDPNLLFKMSVESKKASANHSMEKCVEKHLQLFSAQNTSI